MPAHTHLKESDLSNLINYMSTQWGDKETITLPEVINALESCP